jgi:ATP-dependent protease ClpP protease subunit
MQKLDWHSQRKDNSKFIAALSENIGKSAKTLIKDIGNDFYMDAKTAKKYGVIDRIL